jgi:hypothetical protein
LREGALFISTYYRATCAKARPVNIFYNRVKFCAQQTIISKEKKQEEETVVARYENLALDSRAYKQ